MLDFLEIVLGVLDLASFVLAALKHWRLSLGFLAAASGIGVICYWFSSPTIRWVAGFHLFVAITTIAIMWERKRGRLKD